MIEKLLLMLTALCIFGVIYAISAIWMGIEIKNAPLMPDDYGED